MNSLLDLFQEASASRSSSKNALAKKFWLNIPQNTVHLQKLVKKRREKISDEKRKKKNNAVYALQAEITKQHRKRGLLTGKLRKQIKRLTQGIIEVGHQPLFLGGGSFVFNKIIFTHTLSEHTATAPLLFVGDHDSVQNELLITRFPQSHTDKSLELKNQVHPSYNDAPIWAMDLPKEQEMFNYLQRIENNYTNLFRYADIKEKRDLMDERLEGLLSLIKRNYYQANSLADWSQRIWESILIYANELGIPIITASNEVLRQLLVPSYEKLLKQENLRKFIVTINQTRAQIIDHGYEPGFGERDADHLPFYIECPKCERHIRIEGELKRPGVIDAECSFCSEKTVIEYDPKNPDLSDWASYLSPRVDTRTFVIADTFPVDVHVGGTGELIYHAQIYPAYQEFLTPPIFLKYNPIYYNTPWIEKTAELELLKDKTLQNNDFLAKAARISSIPGKKINSFVADIEETINATYENLNKEIKVLNEDFESTRDIDVLKKSQKLSTYLSQAFGHYTNNQYKQTVSWNWLDLVLLTKVNDLAGTYKRMFNENMSFARTLYYVGSKYN